jgi:predicted membrane channel-forming protein YqfA (hemolysin III family)
MEIIYFTLAAAILYVAADWILKRMETAAGKRFEKRSLIFFVILMTMAVTSFALIRTLTGQ